jgi:hypothetical protein
VVETRQPTGTSSAFSYTKLAPLCPQLARTLDELGDAFDDEGARLPPPVGSVEGLPEDGDGDGLSVGEGLVGDTEPGVPEGDSGGATGVSLVGEGEELGLGATSAGEGVEGRVPGAEGISPAPPVEGADGVPGVSTDGAPPGEGADGVPAGASTVGAPPV